MTEVRTTATLVAVLVVVSVAVAAVPAAAGPLTGANEATEESNAKTTPNPATAGSDSDGSPPAALVRECEYPFEYTDDTGTTVTISEDPDRVVAMAPSAAQTMWEIGGKDEVVGVSRLSYYLDGAGEKANISAPGFGRYNVERIVALEPDVVLAPNVVRTSAVDGLREAGVEVVKFPAATSIEDVENKTRLIGHLTGNCEGAVDAVAWMEANLDAIESAVADADRPSVLYSLGGGYTVGRNTFIDDTITAAGATNIVAAANISGYPEINEELVVTRDPEYLLVTAPDPPIAKQSPYNSTTAVREGNIVVVNPNYLNQPAPRSVVYAVRNMTEQFHAETFERVEFVTRPEAAATPTPTRTPMATATATETGTPTATETRTQTQTTTAGGATPTETTGGGLPGFGSAAVFVAVLVTTLLVFAGRRRQDRRE